MVSTCRGFYRKALILCMFLTISLLVAYQKNITLNNSYLKLGNIINIYFYSNFTTFNTTTTTDRPSVLPSTVIVQKQKCDVISKKLVGALNMIVPTLDEDKIEKYLANQNIKLGGKWSPSDCIPRHHIAILIPYKNREEHLKKFLYHLHPILARQEVSYGIYVIESFGNITFNRGLLLNVGFIESNKDSNNEWQCHAYHDVDLLPEDDRVLYICPESPMHLAHMISTHGYRVLYKEYFGGASILTKEQYNISNGYSNLFFGWGGEDDDHYNRVVSKGYKVISSPDPYNRFLMLGHQKDKPNPDRFNQLYSGKKRFAKEGLNTVEYEIVKIERKALYTHIFVNYDQTKLLSVNYT